MIASRLVESRQVAAGPGKARLVTAGQDSAPQGKVFGIMQLHVRSRQVASCRVLSGPDKAAQGKARCFMSKREREQRRLARRRAEKDAARPPLVCHECGSPAVCVDSVVVYVVRSYGWMWQCPNHPTVYVGCHKGTRTPLGTLAGPLLRMARREAHHIFDRHWKDVGLTRSEAYLWLAEKLGIEPKDCHIGMFDLATCERVIAIAYSEDL